MKCRKIAAMMLSMALIGSTGIAVQAEDRIAVQAEDRIAVQIMLEGDTAEAGSDSVKIEGTVVTITEGGTYMLSGSLSNGQVVVDAGDDAKVSLILNGVRISSDGSDCIYVKSAGQVKVTMSKGSENILSAADGTKPGGKPGYADDYEQEWYDPDDWDEYRYWNEDGDSCPERDGYGYWDDDQYSKRDGYEYRDDYGNGSREKHFRTAPPEAGTGRESQKERKQRPGISDRPAAVQDQILRFSGQVDRAHISVL